MSDLPEIELTCSTCKSQHVKDPQPPKFVIEFTCGCVEPTCLAHMVLEVSGRAIWQIGHASCGSPFAVGIEKMTLF